MNEQSSKRFVPLDDDDAPSLTEEFFRKARYRINGVIVDEGIDNPPRRPVPRGRPPQGAAPKIQQSLRLSPEVLEWFRGTGEGWQARIDEVLRAHVAKATGRKAA